MSEKPTVEITPKSLPTMLTGGKLTLTCKVNKATSKIIWKKNGVSKIPRAHISENGDTLVIDGVEAGDSGDYFCEAHNQAGSVTSSIVKIKVRGKMDSFVILEITRNE